MNHLASSKYAGRVLIALVSITSVLLTVGCGSSGGGLVIGKGGFGVGSLSGSYAYTLKGYGFSNSSGTAANFFAEGGVFTADGKGNITAGTDDFVLPGGSPIRTPIPGTYSIGKDGTGSLQFNANGTAFAIFAITLSDTGNLYMEEADGAGTSAGSAH